MVFLFGLVSCHQSGGCLYPPFLYSCCHSITYPREKLTLRQTLIADTGTLSENKEKNLRFSHITLLPKWERNPKLARQHVGNARQSVMVFFLYPDDDAGVGWEYYAELRLPTFSLFPPPPPAPIVLGRSVGRRMGIALLPTPPQKHGLLIFPVLLGRVRGSVSNRSSL